MSVTVSANGRTVVHQASEGIGLGFPDACMTPPDGRVVPYLNFAISKDAAGTCVSVFCDGHAVMKKSSYFATSYGDELGSLGGVISGTFKGKASFITASPNVFFEGEPAPREGDWVEGNHGSPSNVSLGRWIQKVFASFPWERVIICAAMCACHSAGQREPCVRGLLSTRRYTTEANAAPKQKGGSVVHDPKVPGIYVEVTMLPDPRKKNGWVPVLTKEKNTVGVPIPSSDYIPGSIRPDVVVAKNPLEPLTPENIKAVYELKFPGDELSPQQKKLYPKAAGKGEFVDLDIKKCNCALYEPPPFPIRLPKWEKLKPREPNWRDKFEVPPWFPVPVREPQTVPAPGRGVPVMGPLPPIFPPDLWKKKWVIGPDGQPVAVDKDPPPA